VVHILTAVLSTVKTSWQNSL